MLKRYIKNALKKANLEITRFNKKPVVFFEIDKEFYDLYSLALEKTQNASTDNLLKRQRYYMLMQLLKQALPMINNGHVAECGSWRGTSAYQIALYLKKYGFQKKFFIFDSFEGLSSFQKEDLENNPVLDEGRRRGEFACSLDIVRENLKEFDFMEYKKGWVPERFSDVDNLMFSFVNIDLDLYQPIKDSLEFFYPRMIKGGIISLDDYGYLSFPGAKSSVDEFVKNKDLFFLHFPSAGAYILKK